MGIGLYSCSFVHSYRSPSPITADAGIALAGAVATEVYYLAFPQGSSGSIHRGVAGRNPDIDECTGTWNMCSGCRYSSCRFAAAVHG